MSEAKFKAIPPKHDASREQACIAFWKNDRIFEKSVERRGDAPRFVFYEGPPTANGKPHVGHLIPRILKDVFPRYKTMQGFCVERKGGWDTHGLPVELEVERALGMKDKSEIESYGPAKFVEKCKESVWTYKSAWEEMLERYGFWIDVDDPYITLESDYIESLWWTLAQAWERGLLYRGHKVVPYCARCGTALSSHEVAQGYELVKETSIYVRFPIKGEPGTALLVWTTTPWTLPANMAVSVGPRIEYGKVRVDGEFLIVARDLVERLFGENAEVVEEMCGADLVGKEYVPPFDLYHGEGRAHVLIAGDFVTTNEGTGMVHTAPAFGQDDYDVCAVEKIPVFQPVGLDGRFTEEGGWLEGKFVKDADPEIVADLAKRGIVFREEMYEHDYPFCWRCDSPLLYYARSSWFLKMTDFREQLLANNRGIHWYPEHIRDGRFGDFLENVVDWAISRDRYWGTPLPIWVCGACGHEFAVASRADLVEKAADRSLAEKVELHRPYVDDVTLVCPECGEPSRRVDDVVDCWFDSGCMHTAQLHYPFENRDAFDAWYPADFIAEAQDQTRGWFYTLLATSTLLYGTSCYRNVICTGLGLDREGNKMSKSKGNVIDPMEIVERVGADAVRWYMCTVTMPWNSRPFDESLIQDTIKGVLGTLRNVCAFFVTYANLDGFDPVETPLSEEGRSFLDRWVLDRLNALVGEVVGYMDAFDVTHACRSIEKFVSDDLSNWYVRLGRARFWKSQESPDKAQAYATLYHCLTTLARLVAPVVPFVAEEIYGHLVARVDPSAPESVHLTAYPSVDPALAADRAADDMENVRRAATLALSARNAARVKIRQPLARLAVLAKEGDGQLSDEGLALLAREVNVKEIVTQGAPADFVRFRVKLQHGRVGPRYGKLTQHITGAVAQLDEESTALFHRSGAINVSVEGHEVHLTAEDVRFEEEPLPDVSVADDARWFIALDTRVTDDLRLEGLARDLVRQVQVARKNAGFQVQDRIACFIDASGDMLSALSAHRDMIAGETLAVRLEPGAAGEEGCVAARGKIQDSEFDIAMKVVSPVDA